MYSTFFAVEDISNIDFVKNRQMADIVEDAVSCYFRHHDALRTNIDM